MSYTWRYLGVFQVFAHDLHQNAVRGLGGVFEVVVGLLVEEARHVEEEFTTVP